MIEVLFAGAYSTVQDLGRRGQEVHGMPPSGAMDPFLASVANRLAGNDPASPLLEFALVGPNLHFHRDVVVALAGHGVRYRRNGRPVPELRAFSMPAGNNLEFAGMDGWFGYLAFAGGLSVTKVLGSASTYALGGIGRRLMKGDRLACDKMQGAPLALRREAAGLEAPDVLRILPAMHTGFFTSHVLGTLTSNEYRILPRSDRMGIALEGPPLESPRIVRSVPAFPGSIQILPSGQPLILGPEGPTTGGYPQIAILCSVSWTALAHARPGQAIRFEWTQRDQALQMREFRDRIFQTEAAWESA